MSIDELLDSILPGYTLLGQEDRKAFEQTEFGISFAALVEEQNNSNFVNNSWEQLLLGSDSKDTQEQLITQFKNSLTYTDLKAKVVKKTLINLTERTKLLTYYFPLLDPAFDQLVQRYTTSIVGQDFNASELELNFITTLIANDLNTVGQALTDLVSADKFQEFNKQHAPLLAQKVIDTFVLRRPLLVSELFGDYQKDLLLLVHDQIVSVHDKKPELDKKKYQDNVHAISNLLWNDTGVAEAKQYITQLSQVRMLLIKAGLLGQNDNSVAVILDLFYVNQVKEEIIEFRHIIGKLLIPFKPLFDEFKDIANHETNPLFIFFRIVILFAIIIGFVIGISFLLSPLALPEAVVAFIIIPVLLFVGMGIASAYASIKDEVCHFFNKLYYGGTYAIPGYQINPRMVRAFKSHKQAQSVRDYYVNQLEQCDLIEHELKIKEHNKVLNEIDVEQRQYNCKRRIALITEWYDIHSNGKLAYNPIKEVVMRRLEQDLETTFDNMETLWQKKDEVPVTLMIDCAVQEVAPHFIATVYPPSPTTQRHMFFKPFCVAKKETLEHIDSVMLQLGR